jgi:hypothetical protein
MAQSHMPLYVSLQLLQTKMNFWQPVIPTKTSPFSNYCEFEYIPFYIFMLRTVAFHSEQ